MLYGCGVALCYWTQTAGNLVMVPFESVSLSKVTSDRNAFIRAGKVGLSSDQPISNHY